MISDTNAIVDPWTVVIVPIDTAVADDTVSATRSSYGMAFGAQRGTIKKLQQFHEVNVMVHNISWIGKN